MGEDADPYLAQGMQIQPDQVTIEGTIHQAMIKAGCVPEGGLEAFRQVTGTWLLMGSSC